MENDSFGYGTTEQKTIGCIVDESWCENDVIKDRLASLFNVNRAKITLLSIDTIVEDDYASTVAIKTLTPNSKSVIDHPEVKFFIDKPYRILIQLYTDNDIRIQWISAHTKSSFRIGLGTNNPRLCDLIINMDSYSCNKVLNEIEKYTSRLDVLKNE